MSLIIPLEGKRFGRLTVMHRVDGGEHGKSVRWVCRCDCGKEKSVISCDLRSGKTLSCTCLAREKLVLRNYRHGLSDHPLHAIWSAMLNRCRNKNDKRYATYGGRGIHVEWKSFEDFYRDVSSGYEAHKKNNTSTTLDRVDNDGPYSRENCRWVTNKENCNNRKNNVWIFRERNAANGQFK